MSFHCLLDKVQAGEDLRDVCQWETSVVCLSFALEAWSMSVKHGVDTEEKAREKLQKVFVLMELSGRLAMMARNRFRFLPKENKVWQGKERRHGRSVGVHAIVLCGKFQLGDFEELFRAHLKSVGLGE